MFGHNFDSSFRHFAFVFRLLFRDGNGIHGIFAGENEKSRAKKEEREIGVEAQRKLQQDFIHAADWQQHSKYRRGVPRHFGFHLLFRRFGRNSFHNRHDGFG